MQPTSYTITFSDKERDALIFALGGSFRNVRDGVGMFISPTEYLQLSQRVMHSKPDAQAAREMSGTAAASSVLSPSVTSAAVTQDIPRPAPGVTVDHWHADSKGNRRPPTDFESKTLVVTEVTPGKTGPGADIWRVQFRGAKANCFDKELAAYLAQAKAIDKPIVVHLRRSGNYLNIVGVRV